MEELKIVRFHAEWCGPCKALAPALKEVAKGYGVEVVDVDVEVDIDTKDKHGIMSVPTVLLMKGDEVLDRISGKLPIEVYEEKIAANL